MRTLPASPLLACWIAPILLGAALARSATQPESSARVALAALAAAPSSSAATALLATISGASIPADPSPVPKPAEWITATAVRLNRGDQGSCTASLVREWLRLRCPTWVGGGLVAGDPKGVTLTALGDPLSGAESDGTTQNRAVITLVLPLRRGEAKVVTFLQLAQEYNSAASAEGGTLSVVWRAGRPDPALVMTRLPVPPLQ